MMSLLRTMLHRRWRIALGAAAIIVTAASARAQMSPNLPGVTLQLPSTLFDGNSSSKIVYQGSANGGGLTVNAAAFQFNPKGSATDIYLIVTQFIGPVAPENGNCSFLGINGYFVENADGSGDCYSDLGSTPYAPYGSVAIKTSYNNSTGVITSVGPLDVDACGVQGGGSDFCATGVVLQCKLSPGNYSGCYSSNVDNPWQIVVPQGVLLRGKLANLKGGPLFGYKDSNSGTATKGDGTPILVDQFEFLIELTGGGAKNLYAPIFGTARSFVDVAITFGCGGTLHNGVCNWTRAATPLPLPAGATGSLDWTNGFVDVVEGEVDSVKTITFSAADNQNGTISGVVTDANTAAGIPGAVVEITGPVNTTATTLPDGTYTAIGLSGGPGGSTYTVTVYPPTGYTFSGSPQSVQINMDSLGDDSQITGIDFQLTSVPVISFTTYNQAQWGAKPRGQNAATLLAANFAALYSSGLTIGGTYTIIETNAEAVQTFLPQEGLPQKLTANYVDPAGRALLVYSKRTAHHRKLGSLAGETMALELNVRFSAAALTRVGLGNLKTTSGLLKGKSVNDILGMANTVLGGGALPAGIKNCDDLEDIVERINKNYQAGTTNKGYLQ